MKIFNVRVRAVVCLISFIAGLLSASVAPVMAQSSVSVSPGSRISVNTGYNSGNINPGYSPYNSGATYQNTYNSYGAVNPGYNTGYPTQQSYGYDSGYQTAPMGNQTQAKYYNPAYDSRTSSMYDQRYNSTYGTRYENSYYYGSNEPRSYELPGIMGAVAGIALGATTFGWIGAIAGGLAGYFIGDKIGEWMYPTGSQQKNPYRPSSKVSLVSGLVGAAAGIALLSSFGIWGMAIGASAGWYLAKATMKLVAPQFYYYGFQREGQYQYGTGQAYHYAPETTVAGPAAATNTQSAVSSKPLSELQEDFYQSMRDYRKVLSDNEDEEDIKAKRETYIETQKTYNAAKNAVIEIDK